MTQGGSGERWDAGGWFPVGPAQGSESDERFRPPDTWPAATEPLPESAPRGASPDLDRAPDPGQTAIPASPYSWAPLPEPVRRESERAPRTVRRSTAALLVVVALLAGMVLGGLGAREWFGLAATPASTTPTSSSTVVRAPDSVAGIAQAVLPSTVYIEAASSSAAASGTGLVLRSDGYIVTNNHVISLAADGGTIQVTFADGSVAEAEIVGRTTDYDLAVLKVDRTGLQPLPLADSDQVAVGDPVIAVGAPLGLEGTVTSGIVSALNRAVTAGSATATTFINAIQTDAAINPGNSGGPLVNASGEVIGINTAIAQASGLQATGSIGLGFAIPSNQVKRTTDQLIETGVATYPIIGILLDGRYTGEGVQVATSPTNGNEPVTPGGPGEKAGIKPGDIILSIDGRPMTSADEVIVYVRAHAPGDVITLSIRRGGRVDDVEVTLGEQQAD